MAKATIKTNTGAVITIEGSEKEVSNLIAAYEEGARSPAESKGRTARPGIEKSQRKKREGAADLIGSLRESGFFDKPKPLGEISEALEEKGFLYPTTSLSGVVLGLVKRRHLRRKKVDGRWVYGK
jgi:hypothetical protein